MNIAIGSDHAGYEYKGFITEYLEEKGHNVIDCGTFSSEAADYPDYAYDTAQKVVSKEAEFGILICGTGIGISIAANKVEGIRAAVVSTEFTAESSKTHNHANVIAFGSRVNTIEEVLHFLDVFMNAKWSKAERHTQRVDKIRKIEVKKWEK